MLYFGNISIYYSNFYIIKYYVSQYLLLLHKMYVKISIKHDIIIILIESYKNQTYTNTYLHIIIYIGIYIMHYVGKMSLLNNEYIMKVRIILFYIIADCIFV